MQINLDQIGNKNTANNRRSGHYALVFSRIIDLVALVFPTTLTLLLTAGKEGLSIFRAMNSEDPEGARQNTGLEKRKPCTIILGYLNTLKISVNIIS